MDAPLREAVNDVSNGKSLDENADKNREFYFGQLLLAVDVYSGRHHHSRLYGAVPHSDKSDSPGWRRRYSRFFSAFRHALHPGVLLSLITAGGSLLLYTCVDFGYQMMRQNAVGTAYFSVGCILAYAWTATVFYLAPALSRFEGGVLDILRIAFYLPFRNFSVSCCR